LNADLFSFKKSVTTTTPATQKPNGPAPIRKCRQSTINSWLNVRLGRTTVSDLSTIGTLSSADSASVEEEEFPGKDPLYDCFVAALSQSETNHTRRIEQLEVAFQQTNLIIQIKDDLLNIKEETLLANKALMSGKDDIIKV
jgi:hypothetical protein